LPWPSGRTAQHRARERWRHPLKRLVSRLVPFGGRRGHRRSRSSRARSIATSRSTFTACFGSVTFGAAAIRCPSAPWPSPSPAWLSLSPFLVGSAPLRRWIVTSDQPTVQIAEGHYPESFPRRQTSTIERLRTILLNGGVRWVRRSHVAPPLLRCSTPEHR